MSRKDHDSRTNGRVRWAAIVLGALVALGGLATWLGGAVTLDRPAMSPNAAADAWQRAHWRRPIPLQGALPAGYVAETAGLRSENCAVCHPLQAADWNRSLHAAAMGPGVAAQWPALSAEDRALCSDCHAPLGEQWAELPKGAGWRANSAFDGKLQQQGVVCAACHVRAHVRHGPPLAEGRAGISQLFHGQPVRTPHFEASEFCKSCHQHEAGVQAPNGKPVENTYQEWLHSPAARAGQTCQSCHMPGRRHLWKGIHDPEMTRAGVTIETAASPRQPREGEVMDARLSLTNSGTGHAFPTYTTPAVILRAAFQDAAGKALPGAPVAEMILQRRLDMSTEPWGEVSDTRVFPGKTATLAVKQAIPFGARSLRLWIVVEPDRFYGEFFRERLNERPSTAVARQYRAALLRTRQTPYVLFESSIPIIGGN